MSRLPYGVMPGGGSPPRKASKPAPEKQTAPVQDTHEAAQGIGFYCRESALALQVRRVAIALILLGCLPRPALLPAVLADLYRHVRRGRA